MYYKLTAEDWLEAVKTLKLRELKVLYYLRSICPFEDRELEIDVYRLAARLEMHHQTVERSIRRLEQAKMLKMRLKIVRITLTDPDCPDTDDTDPETAIAIPSPSFKGSTDPKKGSTDPQLSLLDASFKGSTDPEKGSNDPKKGSTDPRKGSTDPFFDLKPTAGKGFTPSKTNKTLKTKRQREREDSESFPQELKEWLTRKAEALPKKPALLSAWIVAQAKKPEVIAEFEQWRSRNQTQAIAPFPMQAIAAIGPGDDDWQLNQLRSEWAIGNDATRSAMADQLARHPKYRIGDRGPERRAH